MIAVIGPIGKVKYGERIVNTMYANAAYDEGFNEYYPDGTSKTLKGALAKARKTALESYAVPIAIYEGTKIVSYIENRLPPTLIGFVQDWDGQIVFQKRIKGKSVKYWPTYNIKYDGSIVKRN